MEICLYPYFLSPGDDMCFTYYESFPPLLSTKAKEKWAKYACKPPAPGFAYGKGHITNKTIQYYHMKKIHLTFELYLSNIRLLQILKMKIRRKCFVNFKSPYGLAIRRHFNCSSQQSFQ